MIGVLSLFLSSFSYAQCNNGVTAGGFDSVPVGEYAAPGYIGVWKAAGDDRIKIVSQGTSNGALIRDSKSEEFSLEQTIYSVKPSFAYDLSFNYGNWTDGCKPNANANIRIAVYYDDSPTAAHTQDFNANDASTALTATVRFTTPAVISKVRIVITDPGSPPATCGAVIDDIMLISPMAVTTNATPVICYGDNNGGFSVQASGGAAPYTATYSQNGNPPVPLALTSGQGAVNNLPAGTYTLAITDANNCTVNRTVTIAGPATALSVTATPVMCYGESSGSVQVSATGGTPGYTYSIGGTSNTTGFFNNLPAGNYTVTVRDQNNCLTSTTFTIGQPASPLAAQAVPGAVTCNGGANGSIQATANGGVAPYRFTLNGITNTTGSFANLVAGSYTVTVTDANNCVDYVYTTISQPPPIVPAVSSTDVRCFGGSDGTLTVSATGGTGPYSYTVNGITNTTGTFTGLPAGSYKVRITDQANGCFVQSTVVIGQPAAELTAVATPAKCFGEPTGSVTVSASGGTPGYTYTLNGTSNNAGFFPNLAAGTYSIIVQDAQGCQITVTATIGEPTDPLTIAASAFNNNCRGGSTGSITAVASGGVPGYTYTLNGISNTGGNFTNLAAGTYLVLVEDANGCSASTEVIISEPPTSLNATATAQGTTCNG
ncbi:MAG TPA: SprB repeat-containing protein, partial [Sphingobacteriaceae bacterium]